MTPLPGALSAGATDANPNGKRHGKRDGKGRIVGAYGFDLSPLAARYVEFARLSQEGRAEREAMGRLRWRATIARKGIVQILDTARDCDLTGEKCQFVGKQAQYPMHSPATARAGTPLRPTSCSSKL